jgi:hypothetical protein
MNPQISGNAGQSMNSEMPSMNQPVNSMSMNPHMSGNPPMNQSMMNQMPPMQNRMAPMNPAPLNTQQQFNDLPPLGQQNNMSFQGPDLQFNSLPPLDAPPPMGPMGSADMGVLPEKKKRFLGF